MTRLEAIAMIDAHKNKLLHPTEMLRWTWLRVILSQMTDEQWEAAMEKATVILAQ